MADFLSPLPRMVDFTFTSARSNIATASGLSSASFRSQGWWQGNLTLASSQGGTSRDQVLSLSRADSPDTGFLLDIMLGEGLDRDAASGTIDLPAWVKVTGNADVNSFIVPTGLTLREGDLVAFRQTIAPGHVTARVIASLFTSAGETEAQLASPLPSEFFAITAGTEFQVCANRPHIRARFAKSPMSWRKREARLMQPNRVAWIEDTFGTVEALRSVSGVTGVEPNALLTQDGTPILTQSGETLLRQ